MNQPPPPPPLRSKLAPDLLQRLRNLASVAVSGRDAVAVALALGDVTVGAVPGANAYVVLVPPFAAVPSVVAGTPEARDSGPLSSLPAGRFERELLAKAAPSAGPMPPSRSGRVHHYVSEPIFVPEHGASPVGLLVAISPHGFAEDVAPTLAVIASLGAAALAALASMRASERAERWEVVALDLQRQLASAPLEDVLDAVLARLGATLGATGALGVFVDPVAAEGRVASRVGALQPRDPNVPAAEVDRDTIRRLVALRSVTRLRPSEITTLTAGRRDVAEVLVVPAVADDAVFGLLLFLCPVEGVDPSVAVPVAEHMALALYNRHLQQSTLATHIGWENALNAVDAPMWVTDGEHHIRRMNRAARGWLDVVTPERTRLPSCREVLEGAVVEACDADHALTGWAFANDRRYTVRAVPRAEGGAIYVALPVSGDDELTSSHRVAAGEYALAAVADMDSPLAVLVATLASLAQELGRNGVVFEGRLGEAWKAILRLREGTSAVLDYFRANAPPPAPMDLASLLHLALVLARASSPRVEFVREWELLPDVPVNPGRFLLALGALMGAPSGRVLLLARDVGDEVEIRVEREVEAAETPAPPPPIAEEVAREHGGWVMADGPVTVIRIPRRRVEDPTASEGPPATTARPAQDSPRDRRARVLLVDDEPGIRRALARTLSLQHEVETASDGDEALQMIEEHDAYDVIVTDILMPRRNGFDLYGAIAQRWPHLLPRIVFITAAVHSAEAERFFSAVSNPLLPKPVMPDMLRDVVAHVLERA